MRLVKFIVTDVVAEIDSDETSIGTRQTREITAQELAALLLSMFRGN